MQLKLFNLDKYEFTDETIIHYGHTLYRIRALRDIPRHNVKAGDLGGFIESEVNLSQEGDCWVGDNAYVFGGARVCINACVCGDVILPKYLVMLKYLVLHGYLVTHGYMAILAYPPVCIRKVRYAIKTIQLK